MDANPCGVCGGTDLNLVGGFYYCVECGTQDTTVQETIVERVELKGGVVAVGARRKISKKKQKIKMSDEWYKWNGCNMILNSLVDDLIALGAEPSVKPKVLWIWSRLVKKKYNKTEYNLNSTIKKNLLINNEDDCEKHKDNDDGTDNDDNDEGSDNDDEVLMHIKEGKRERINPSVKTMVAIIYIALNLDKSDIQLSHLMRLICEGRLNLKNREKYLPADFPFVDKLNARTEFATTSLRIRAQTLFHHLNLGTCLVPDMKKIASQFVKELCLPKDLKELVYSLMIYSPWEDLTDRKYEFPKYSFRQLPHFDAIVMAYIVVALKMCFGLDDDYEIKLSDAVERINEKDNNLKSYRIGNVEPTERLFSFREWVIYMEFRKIIICKYYQPMTLKFRMFDEDCLTAEMLKDGKVVDDFHRLKDRLTFDILNRIKSQTDFGVISKEEFPVSQTPYTAYVEFIIPRLRDYYMRQLLSEDFSRYSIKYACVGMALYNENGDNIIKGVTEENKCFKRFIIGNSHTNKEVSAETVFLRNYENESWKKDFEVETVKKVDNKENENVDDVCNGSSRTETTDSSLVELSPKQEAIEELNENENIFDDVFDAVPTEDKSDSSQHLEFQFDDYQIHHMPEISMAQDEPEDAKQTAADTFDPETFDRKEVIKHLVLSMCRKYLIRKPSKYVDRKPRDTTRKSKAHDVPDIGAPKPEKMRPVVKDILDIIDKYHELVKLDVPEGVVETASQPELDIDPSANGHTEEPTVFEGEPPPYHDDNPYVTMEVDTTEGTNNTQTENVHQEIPNFEMAFEDPEINAILRKHILTRNERAKRRKLNTKDHENTHEDTEELNSEEEIDSEPTVDVDNLESFTELPNDFQNCMYYTRKYFGHYMGRDIMAGLFEAEMNAGLAVSLKYVLQLCSVVSQSSAFQIYKYVQRIEQRLMYKYKGNKLRKRQRSSPLI